MLRFNESWQVSACTWKRTYKTRSDYLWLSLYDKQRQAPPDIYFTSRSDRSHVCMETGDNFLYSNWLQTKHIYKIDDRVWFLFAMIMKMQKHAQWVRFNTRVHTGWHRCRLFQKQEPILRDFKYTKANSVAYGKPHRLIECNERNLLHIHSTQSLNQTLY